jgi:hypothetical protein
MLKLPILGQSPESLTPGGKMPLNAFKGIVATELGLVPGFELPAGLEAALAFQFLFAGGDIPQYGTQVPAVKMKFYSLGGGIRVDRPFWFGKNFGVAPLFGLYIHYQDFYRADATGGGELVTAAFAPEIGINQFFRFDKEGWRIAVGAVAGTFLYGGQNLTYLKLSLGVEYAFY